MFIMAYSSLESCLLDLERHGQLVRVREEVDPNLEMASIQLRLYASGGPAVLFERVKGTPFRAATNIFGTLDRSRFIFRHTIEHVQTLIRLRNDPTQALRHPLKYFGTGLKARFALPKRNPIIKPVLAQRVQIQDLPLIRHWPKDGGAFVTLPQVYSEDPDATGVMKANLGMYRVQLSGNEYTPNREIGVHYQIHRGIGVHQARANAKGQPLNVSVFVGGPPSHTLAAVMPLPEGIGELTFAGLLGGRRFRYVHEDGFCISTDADFVITGTINNNDTKPEGPFGDHLGYYSLMHRFPVMKVRQVYARKNAIWPFTVVGRPPQEDTSFGALIHELTGDAIPAEIPGLKEVHAVDAAGVHPLLLAIGSERYTPFLQGQEPSELLTIANRVLGTGQLSLAKYLLIAADDSNRLDTHNIAGFFDFVLKRFRPERDLHFQTKTTIDTLDYSGTGFNKGSKLTIAVCGAPIRALCTELPDGLHGLQDFSEPALVLPGVVALCGRPFRNYQQAALDMELLEHQLLASGVDWSEMPLIIMCDDPHFLAQHINNFLWVTFTRSNPSHDVYGIQAFQLFKHWGCKGPLIIDARIKPHHAPVLELDPATERRVDRLFAKSGSLYGLG